MSVGVQKLAGKQQRVTVGRCLGNGFGREDRGAVIDQDLLTERATHALRN